MLRDVSKLTSDSVALAGASLGAGLGSTLGAGLGAGSAGAGGAATAGPLQGALHDGLCPPQVWVAAGGQNRGAPSARVTRTPRVQTLPTLTGQLQRPGESSSAGGDRAEVTNLGCTMTTTK